MIKFDLQSMNNSWRIVERDHKTIIGVGRTALEALKMTLSELQSAMADFYEDSKTNYIEAVMDDVDVVDNYDKDEDDVEALEDEEVFEDDDEDYNPIDAEYSTRIEESDAEFQTHLTEMHEEGYDDPAEYASKVANLCTEFNMKQRKIIDEWMSKKRVH